MFICGLTDSYWRDFMLLPISTLSSYRSRMSSPIGMMNSFLVMSLEKTVEANRAKNAGQRTMNTYTVLAYDSRWSAMSVSKNAFLSIPGMYMDLMA